MYKTALKTTELGRRGLTITRIGFVGGVHGPRPLEVIIVEG